MSVHSLKKAVIATGSLGLLLAANTASAVTCAELIALDPASLCLENGGSALLVDPINGVQELTVGADTHILNHDFFYDDINARVSADPYGMYDDGTTGYPTYSRDYDSALTLIDGAVAGTNQAGSSTLSLFYQPVVSDKNNQLDKNLPWIQLDFQLVGAGESASIVETFTIINQRNEALDVNLFAFTDVDVGGLGNGAVNDQGELIGSDLTQYRQFDANPNPNGKMFEMIATASPGVDGYLIDAEGKVGNLFNSGVTDDPGAFMSNDPNGGPWLNADCDGYIAGHPNCVFDGANLQMAAMWSRSLAANGGSFTYQHSMLIQPLGGDVPIPAALPLALSGIGLLGFVGRRRKKAAESS